jgi:myosin-crossreactive antigen
LRAEPIFRRKSGDRQLELIAVNDGDLVFLQNGSMTDASSLGSMTNPPGKLTKKDSGAWTLWEKLAAGRPEFGNPAAFNSCIAQSCWESFTVTLKNPAFFDQMNQFSGNEAGTGGQVTLSIPCERPRWPFMSCWASPARSHLLRHTTNRCTRNLKRCSRRSSDAV